MKNKRKNADSRLLFFTVTVITAAAAFTLRLVSAFNNSDGQATLLYTDSYPLILLGEYAAVTALLLPFIKKSGSPTMQIHLIPLMLLTALGMMRADAPEASVMTADTHTAAIAFLIFFASSALIFLTGHSLTGLAGAVAGTLVFPLFGITFAPFIAAAAYLSPEKNKRERKISLALHGIFTLAAAVWGIIKANFSYSGFSAKYIPVLLLTALLAVLIIMKKEYRLLPAALLPLFPLLSGIFTAAFPTALYTLSASIAPLVLVLGLCALTGRNETVRVYAERLIRSPAAYIITAVFILHTCFVIFALPGTFRSTYL